MVEQGEARRNKGRTRYNPERKVRKLWKVAQGRTKKKKVEKGRTRQGKKKKVKEGRTR